MRMRPRGRSYSQQCWKTLLVRATLGNKRSRPPGEMGGGDGDRDRALWDRANCNILRSASGALHSCAIFRLMLASSAVLRRTSPLRSPFRCCVPRPGALRHKKPLRNLPNSAQCWRTPPVRAPHRYDVVKMLQPLQIRLKRIDQPLSAVTAVMLPNHESRQ